MSASAERDDASSIERADISAAGKMTIVSFVILPECAFVGAVTAYHVYTIWSSLARIAPQQELVSVRQGLNAQFRNSVRIARNRFFLSVVSASASASFDEVVTLTV